MRAVCSCSIAIAAMLSVWLTPRCSTHSSIALGPGTEPESVLVIQDTLRRGADCHVRISNYRKTGELFENLLTMRPVHDSNGVYRYCIGLQYEVQKNTPLSEQVAELDSL